MVAEAAAGVAPTPGTAVDDAAREAHFSMAYGQLRSMARRLLGNQQHVHTLQPTAVVHEVWLRMYGTRQPQFRDRVHFLRTAVRSMRQLLC